MRKLITLQNKDNLNYYLIAIRNKLEDYLFAYNLNKGPFFNFIRMNKDLSCVVNHGSVYFATFEYQNRESGQVSFLIKNNSFFEEKASGSDVLFNNYSIYKKITLLPELKEFDYFLKLNGIWKAEEISQIRQYLNSLESVESEIIVNINSIGSISNLIF
ncbi:MAG: hypothetical protein CMP65_04535 [Flavobacteriales bacterium]|nr:hypothetical protein [Flavobacteriales bacterium]|tara:strand:+ start:1899 stop:2375 length:477 start_codon:yes stop_codon:yes gene_type:complete